MFLSLAVAGLQLVHILVANKARHAWLLTTATCFLLFSIIGNIVLIVSEHNEWGWHELSALYILLYIGLISNLIFAIDFRSEITKNSHNLRFGGWLCVYHFRHLCAVEQ